MAQIFDTTITGDKNANTLYGGAGNDAIYGGDGGDLLYGKEGNDSLDGGSGNDQLDGGTGDNTLVGGLGNDRYYVRSATDVLIENVGEGSDLVVAYVDYTLADNIENLVLQYTAFVGTGNAQNNVITGNSGNNTLSGGAGNDTLYGGYGDDTYVVDSVGDVVNDEMDNGGYAKEQGGTDSVLSSVTFTLGNYLENLTLTGSANLNGTGNALNNVITGNSGDNVLNGGVGDDTMAGGAGNDTYVVDSANDVVTELDEVGTDTVQSSISYSLGAYVENLTLTGTTAINGTGNALNNVITGNDGNNSLSGADGTDVLYGGAGNDTLDGGVGNDQMAGGADSDTYVVNTAGDVVAELVNEGTDTVQSSITYTLGANVENLTLTGSGALSGTGNALNNVITGNSGDNFLSGSDGNDSLDGGSGNDQLDGGTGDNTLAGGLGNDRYYVRSATDVLIENVGEGSDVVIAYVDYTLADNIENLDMQYTAFVGTGNALNNVIKGNSGNNTLSGGAGNDTLYGGYGDDTYVVDSVGDVVNDEMDNGGYAKEQGGTDSVLSSVTFTLGNYLENLTLTGTAAINGTGNTLNNVITGNSGDNMLSGGAGNDTLIGGAGNDTFVVDSFGDVVTELDGGGTDTVKSSISYTLGAFVEKLELTGTDSLSGTGNALNNVIYGNDANNVLAGGDGNDSLYGGYGNDYLVGGDGNDYLHGGAGNDTLIGGVGNDGYVIDSIGDVVVEYEGEGTDAVISSISYTLLANFETLQLQFNALNGTGNALANLIYGSGQDNILDGGAGDDTLYGGYGNDTYMVDSVGDIVDDEQIIGNTRSESGTDIVLSSVTFTLSQYIENLTLTGSANLNGTGNALDNVITGNSGDNVLDGGTGNDTMIGGAGNDTYVVDSIGDVVTELDEVGTDTVQSSITLTLGDFVENLTLTGNGSLSGTGNALNNAITGNSGNNLLSGGDGNDTLDGGAGNDTLIGGAGNDTYVVDSIGDLVTELDEVGTDTLQSSISFSLGDFVENLTLTGNGSLSGTGNALNNVITGNSGNNVLSGGDGNDTLNGGTGNDTLVGGAGNDTYVVDSIGDLVTEQDEVGTDTVQSSISYSLGAFVENLTLTGTNALSGTGNALNNVISGNDGNNSLSGADGTDVLSGGVGNDTLDGGAGDDQMAGGADSDTYVVNTAGDVVAELVNEGTDTVQSSITYTLGANVENLTLTGSGALSGNGNALDNMVTGNTGNNALAGDVGNDTLFGGDGNDLVDGGTGNDAVYGGAGNDTLYGGEGDDVLYGGTGKDVLVGGKGNDIYYVDDVLDSVSEAWTDGTDQVFSSVSFTLGTNVDNLTLTGSSGLKGTGNDDANILRGNSGSNTLTGNKGADQLFGAEGKDTLSGGEDDDTLDGGSGADRMVGGAGSDAYLVDDAGDLIVEASGEGTYDLVTASVNYTLAVNVEALTLTGRAVTGTGNGSANTIIGTSGANLLKGLAGNDTLDGGDGNDQLVGGTGNDVLTGGLGADSFVFDKSDGGDRITDFSVGTDKIQLTAALVNILGGRTALLDSGSFHAASGAASGADAGDRLVYDTKTGALYYDADGSGKMGAVKIATLDLIDGAGPELTYTDFIFG